MLSSHNPGDLLPKDIASLNPWARRLLLLRILLISVILIGILFWLMSFLIVPILIVLVAALLAYALVPVIDLLHRVMSRSLAIVLVYVVATVLFALFAYLGVKTLIPQLNSLAQSITSFVAPGTNGQDSPLVQLLKSVGFTQSQIDAASKQLQSQLSSIASNIAQGTLVVVGGLIYRRIQHLNHSGGQYLPASRRLPLRELAHQQLPGLPTQLDHHCPGILATRSRWLYSRTVHYVCHHGCASRSRHGDYRRSIRALHRHSGCYNGIHSYYWHYHCGFCGSRNCLDTKLDNGADYPYLHNYPGLR